MNAQEHYKAAEQWLAELVDAPDASQAALALQTAQVHATLALAASHGANEPPPKLTYNAAPPLSDEAQEKLRKAFRQAESTERPGVSS